MSSSSNGSAETLKLCRFDDGYAPIVLKKTSSDTVACKLIEDILDDALDPTIEFPVEYPQQEDALLLHCRFPKRTKKEHPDDSPVASITGLPEEFERQPTLNMSLYKGSIDSNSNPPDAHCSCKAAHSSWTRQLFVNLLLLSKIA